MPIRRQDRPRLRRARHAHADVRRHLQGRTESGQALRADLHADTGALRKPVSRRPTAPRLPARRRWTARRTRTISGSAASSPIRSPPPIVVRIFTEYVAGPGIGAIAEGLKRDGIPSPSGHDPARNRHRARTPSDRNLPVLTANRSNSRRDRYSLVGPPAKSMSVGHPSTLRASALRCSVSWS